MANAINSKYVSKLLNTRTTNKCSSRSKFQHNKKNYQSLNSPAVGSLELFSVLLLSFFCTSVDLEILVNVFLNPPKKYQKQGINYCTTTILINHVARLISPIPAFLLKYFPWY